MHRISKPVHSSKTLRRMCLVCQRFESITNSRLIHDTRANFAEFFAQVIDVNAKAFTLITALSGPNLANDLVLCDDASRVLGEGLEESKFGGGELDRRSFNKGFVMQQVEFECAHNDLGTLTSESPPLDDGQPCKQLSRAEGFRDIVVSTTFQCLDFGTFLVTHAEDEHGHITPFTQTLEHL